MVFGSVEFILFVLLMMPVYFVFPKKNRWWILLASSLIFYFQNSHWLLLVLLASSMITFLSGLYIDSLHTKKKIELSSEGLSPTEKRAIKIHFSKKTKAILSISVFLDLGTLLFLKYYDFLASGITHFFHFSLPGSFWLLPLGISFYTLQAVGYLFDVYREKNRAARNYGKFLLFLSFFPQIVQGPVASYTQLSEQLTEGHDFSYDRLTSGSQLVLWGFIKKLVIADRVAIPVKALFDGSSEYSGLIVFFAAVLYGIQIYADFSGGIDISRGISEIFGIELKKNFAQPYFSTSLEGFWRRWHISLGTWMRNYVFYPLSLSVGFAKLGKYCRKLFGRSLGKRIPTFFAMFIVYFLVGLWHGTGTKYIAYGLWNGTIIAGSILLKDVFEWIRKKFGVDPNSAGWKGFCCLRTFAIVSFGRFFPRAVSTKQALRMMRSVFVRWYDLSFITNGTLQKLGLNTANWILLALAVFILLYVDVLHERKINIRKSIAAQYIVFRWAFYLAALASLMIFGMYGPGYNSADFIYGQF